MPTFSYNSRVVRLRGYEDQTMKAITANHLTGGHVLFLATGGGWSKHITDASLFSDVDSLATALEIGAVDEKTGHVIGVYDVDVSIENGNPVPTKLRERIRVDGPTTAYGTEMKLEGFYAA